MARTAASPIFSGRAFSAAASGIDAWLQTAAQGDQFTYCEAPQLIRDEAAARARALADKGLVTTHQARREGGGFSFFVMRTGRPIAKKISAADAVLADPITETIYRAIKRAANFGDRCPSDNELAALVHRDFAEKLKSARMWGTGVFDGQTVPRDHVLHDRDVVELHV